MASVGSILSGAFRLFKDEPVTVAIWAGVFIAYTLGTTALALGGLSADFEAMRVGTISPANAIGIGLAFGAAALLFFSVMNCAIYRAILRPEERGFAYLQVGGDEFRLFGLYLILIVAGMFIGLVLGLLMFFVMGGAALASGGSPGGIGFGMLIIFVFLLACVYVAIRLSLIFPTTFLRRKISIDEGWGLSSGNFWRLFLAYLVLWIIIAAVQSVLPGAPGQPGFFESLRNISNPAAMEAMGERQAAAAASMTLMSMLPYILLSSVAQTIFNVMTNAASATAVRDILHDQGEVLDDEIEKTAQIFE